MFRNLKQLGRWLAIAVVVGVMCPAAALVAKPTKPPGGGDPPGSNGGGVIYFSWNGDLYTMNDDGSGIALVAGFPDGYGAWGDPSRQLHAGKRWLVRQHDVPGEFYPDFHDGGTTRKDFANRRVFVALSDAGDVVELEIDPDLEPLDQPKWTVDDGYLSWAGRCWDISKGTDVPGVVLKGGLYRTALTFDDVGNVAAAGASELLVPFSLVPSNVCRQFNDFTDGPDMRDHDWAPDGTQFVFTAISTDEMRIHNVLTEESHVLFAEPGADWMGDARWSPAGDTIMFDYEPDIGHGRVMLITPDGSHSKMLVRGSPEWSVSMGVWSPTGSHLLYQYWDHWYADSHIVRATANGSNKTRITDKSMGRGMGPPRAIGWRAAE